MNMLRTSHLSKYPINKYILSSLLNLLNSLLLSYHNTMHFEQAVFFDVLEVEIPVLGELATSNCLIHL